MRLNTDRPRAINEDSHVEESSAGYCSSCFPRRGDNRAHDSVCVAVETGALETGALARGLLARRLLAWRLGTATGRVCGRRSRRRHRRELGGALLWPTASLLRRTRLLGLLARLPRLLALVSRRGTLCPRRGLPLIDMSPVAAWRRGSYGPRRRRTSRLILSSATESDRALSDKYLSSRLGGS